MDLPSQIHSGQQLLCFGPTLMLNTQGRMMYPAAAIRLLAGTNSISPPLSRPTMPRLVRGER